MNILYLETSSKNCSIAVSNGEKLLCLCEKTSQDYRQSENLHSYIEWALEGAELSLKDLNAICLGYGPGSYTGLRIGSSAAKGFCYGLKIPLIAINSMCSMIEPFLNKGYDFIIPLLDARRMEVYTAIYHGETGKQITNTFPKILDEQSFGEYREQKILFIGDGCLKAKTTITIPQADFQVNIYPSAKYLIRKGVKSFLNKQFEDITYFEPFYLKSFHGTKKI